MGRKISVFALFFAVVICFIFIGCGGEKSPLSSTGNSVSKDTRGLAKSASPDRSTREFEKAYDEVMKILKDLKRYIQKDPRVDRHAAKVKGLAKDLQRALSRLGDAFKNVRTNGAAQSAMRSLGSDIASVTSKLGRYNLSYGFMVNPCALPWIGEYLCKYVPTATRRL